MRSTAAAVALARAARRRLRVVWYVDRELGAGFDELFAPLSRVGDVDVRIRNGRRGGLSEKLLAHELHPGTRGRAALEWIRRRRFDLRLSEAEVRVGGVHGDGLRERVREARSVMLRSYEKFYPVDDGALDIFEPVPELRAAIDRVAAVFDANTIGVHVRRGDNLRSIERSPVAAFIAAMRAEVELRPATRFFVASDSPEVVDRLGGEFPDRVLSRPRDVARDRVAGVRDAVVDLYCLSRTARVLGSYWSSFSHTAAEIGRIAEQTVTGEA